MADVILFLLIYFGLCNWAQVKLFFWNPLSKSKAPEVTQLPEISKILLKKLHLKLDTFIIYDSKILFAGMPSTPRNPKMYISKAMLATMNEDELEWVILHEGAHCVLWHMTKMTVVQAIIAFLGLVLMVLLSFPIWSIPLYALLVGLIAIRAMQHFEYEADSMAIHLVNDPKGVITAQKQLKDNQKNNWFYDEKNFPRKILYWNILPSKRIQMAQAEIAKRRIN